MAKGPEVALATATRFVPIQVAHWCLVGLQVAAGERLGLHLPVNGLQPRGQLLGPVHHALPGNRHPMALAEDLLQPVIRQVVFEPAQEQMDQQSDPRQPLLDQARRQRGDEHFGRIVDRHRRQLLSYRGGLLLAGGRQRGRFLAHKLGADNVAPVELGRFPVQFLGDDFFDLAEGFRVGFDLLGQEHLAHDGEVFRDATARGLAVGARAGRAGRRRRWLGRGGRHQGDQAAQQELELGRIEAFVLRAAEVATEQGLDFVAEQLVLGAEGLVLGLDAREPGLDLRQVGGRERGHDVH